MIGINQACSLRPRSGDMVPLGLYATRNFWGHPNWAQRKLGMYPFIDVAVGIESGLAPCKTISGL